MAFRPFSPSSPTLPPNGEGSLLSLWERERVRENWQGTIARPCAVILNNTFAICGTICQIVPTFAALDTALAKVLSKMSAAKFSGCALDSTRKSNSSNRPVRPELPHPIPPNRNCDAPCADQSARQFPRTSLRFSRMRNREKFLPGRQAEGYRPCLFGSLIGFDCLESNPFREAQTVHLIFVTSRRAKTGERRLAAPI